MKPLISLIIPVFNVEDFLDECIKSALNQTYSNLDIIIIDDGSTDSSKDICDKYERLDKRIVVVHQTNGGLSHARNVGLSLAKGEYIAFLDSDDSYDADAVSTMYDLLIKYKASMSMVNFRTITCDSKLIENNVLPFTSECKCYDEVSFWQIPYTNYCGTVVWTKLYKKELWKDILFPVGMVHEDECVLHKLVSQCQLIPCSTHICMSHRMENKNSISAKGFNVNSLYTSRFLIDRLEYHILNGQNQYLLDCFGFGSRILIEASKTKDKDTYFEKSYKDLYEEYKVLAKKISKLIPSVKDKFRLYLFCTNIRLYGFVRAFLIKKAQ